MFVFAALFLCLSVGLLVAVLAAYLIDVFTNPEKLEGSSSWNGRHAVAMRPAGRI